MAIEIKNTGPGDQNVMDGTTVLKTLSSGQSITIEPADEDPPPPPGGTLAAAITAWNTAKANEKIFMGGAVSFVSPTNFSGNKSYVNRVLANKIRQHGKITRFEFNCSANWYTGFKGKIYRDNASGIPVMVGETEAFLPSSTGVVTYDPTNPVVGVQPGDDLGMYVPSVTAVWASNEVGSALKYETGDVTGAFANSTPYNDYRVDIRGYGPPPFLAVIGDSIQAGHHETFYRPFLDNGISGDPTGQPVHHIRSSFSELTYQNFSKGGQTWAFAVSNIAAVNAVKSRAVIFEFGANDVATGRTWVQVEADMNSCKAGLTNGQKIFVCEITPENIFTDAQAILAQTWNTNYAAWCAANGATLVPCHDAMAQTRSSTGGLDDLKTAYNFDGAHFKVSGISAYAECIIDVLDNYSWP